MTEDKTFLDRAVKTFSTKPTIRKMRSGAHSRVYELRAAEQTRFLKIGDDLIGEKERLEWLAEKIPVPSVLDFYRSDGRQALLLSAVEGTDLAELCKTLSPIQVIDYLVKALKDFHNVDARGCPFVSYKSGSTLVHGDACLPNFILNPETQTIGHIDLGDCGMGDVEVDLSAAVWSLWRNLGPGHGQAFLKAYGHRDASLQEVDRLWEMYAHSPIFER